MTERKRDPERLDRVLSAVLAEAGAGRVAMALEARRAWAEVVGPSLAAHTRAVELTDGVLFVEADHPVYAQEVKLREGDLRGALAAPLGALPIRLVVRSRGAASRAVARADTQLAGAARAVAPSPPGGASEAELARVADPELRAALASLRKHVGGDP